MGFYTVQEDEPQTLIVGDGASARSIAYLSTVAAKPEGANLFWLSGFMSDMASTKAAALAEFAREKGFGFTRFDYSGHGRSGGAFSDGTIGRWLEEAVAVFTHISRGPQVIIGSSMGGHIALLLLRRLIREAPDRGAAYQRSGPHCARLGHDRRTDVEAISGACEAGDPGQRISSQAIGLCRTLYHHAWR